MLRRALLVWGLGHLAVGDRRGWLLLGLQLVAVAGFIAFSAALIEGTRWMLLFPALLAIIALWVGQAIHAHQVAIERGASVGGEIQVAWLLPLVVAVVTAFWLIGGQQASPTAVLHQYVAAWRGDRPEGAGRLFYQPVPGAQMTAAWQAHERHLEAEVAEAAQAFGPFSGLDPEQPHSGLRFVELGAQRTADRAVFAIEITRRQRIETMLFGLLPTATQETVLVERIGLIHVRAYLAVPPAWFGPEWLPARLWLIERLELPLGQPISLAAQSF